MSDVSTSRSQGPNGNGQWDEIIVASNRGPFEYHRRADGSLRVTRGSGGVVSALIAIASSMRLEWIAAPMSDADRAVAGGAEAPPTPVPQRFVAMDKNVYRKYYERFSNGLLWFLQHYMLDAAQEPHFDRALYDAWENGYVTANQAFAKTIEDATRTVDRPLVLIQDYQLYLVPSLVRATCPDAVIQHFTHVPWPETRYWQLLPADMREAICRGLSGADILGFQTRRDAHNFIESCRTFLPEARINHSGRLEVGDHEVFVAAYPISIDVDRLRRVAASAETRRYRTCLQEQTGQYTIVRVDRMEPSKNIVRGFLALDDLFQRRPDLIGKVRLLAFLVPSRESVPVYKAYREQVLAKVEELNRRYARDDWTPISIFYENNLPQAIAALTLYDVLLVNPVIDGMNLVAKEGPVVNDRDGVLVLSEGAGAHDQLGDWALSVAPADVAGISLALEKAIEMPAAERHSRATAIRDSIIREDVHWWLAEQLDDLRRFSDVKRRSRDGQLHLPPEFALGHEAA